MPFTLWEIKQPWSDRSEEIDSTLSMLSGEDSTLRGPERRTGFPRRNRRHLVRPSVAPLAAAGGLFNALASLVVALRFGEISLLGAAAPLLAVLVLWTLEVHRERTELQEHTPAADRSFLVAGILFIVSEVSFFLTLFAAAAYLTWGAAHVSLLESFEGLPVGHLQGGLTPVDLWGLPVLNCALLLLSGTSVSRLAAPGVSPELQRSFLLWTIAYGALFLLVQVVEYRFIVPMDLASGIWPSVFFLVTGFHGAHVAVGLVFLALVAWNTPR